VARGRSTKLELSDLVELCAELSRHDQVFTLAERSNRYSPSPYSAVVAGPRFMFHSASSEIKDVASPLTSLCRAAPKTRRLRFLLLASVCAQASDGAAKWLGSGFIEHHVGTFMKSVFFSRCS